MEKELANPAVLPENTYNMDETGVLLSAARSFQVLPSSDTTFLVTTTTQGTQHIVSLLLVTLDRLQGSCSCRKYDDYDVS
jgi:hypothetical protein